MIGRLGKVGVADKAVDSCATVKRRYRAWPCVRAEVLGQVMVGIASGSSDGRLGADLLMHVSSELLSPLASSGASCVPLSS
jgi:hypothetical protein